MGDGQSRRAPVAAEEGDRHGGRLARCQHHRPAGVVEAIGEHLPGPEIAVDDSVSDPDVPTLVSTTS